MAAQLREPFNERDINELREDSLHELNIPIFDFLFSGNMPAVALCCVPSAIRPF